MENVHTEAHEFAARLGGDRPTDWQVVGEVWCLSRCLAASRDDGDATLEARFHDGSRLALLMTAEGELYSLTARADQDDVLDVSALRDQVEEMASDC